MSKIYWLASYPKSGNTWLRAMLTNYLRDADEPASINELTVSGAAFLSQPFDEQLGIDVADLTERQVNHYRPLIYEKMSAESSEPLFLKVHDAFVYNSDGRPIFSARATGGAVYIVRNPLDVAVSYAHHRDETIDETISHLNCSDAYLAGTKRAGEQLPRKLKSWSEHVRSWADAPGITVRIVRYEDLLRRPREIFAEVVCFAKLRLDARRIEKAVEFSGFEQLRAQEQARGFIEKQSTAKSFFRQGTAGTWRERLTNEQVRRIIDAHAETMRRFGYLNDAGEVLSA